MLAFLVFFAIARTGDKTFMILINNVGGHDGLSIFSTVERYDPVEKVWTMVTPMHTRRCRVGVTTARGKLFR